MCRAGWPGVARERLVVDGQAQPHALTGACRPGAPGLRCRTPGVTRSPVDWRVGPGVAAVEVDLPRRRRRAAGIWSGSDPAALQAAHAGFLQVVSRVGGAEVQRRQVEPVSDQATSCTPSSTAHQAQRATVERQRRHGAGLTTACRSVSHWASSVTKRRLRSTASAWVSRLRSTPSSACHDRPGHQRHDEQRHQHLHQREAARAEAGAPGRAGTGGFNSATGWW